MSDEKQESLTVSGGGMSVTASGGTPVYLAICTIALAAYITGLSYISDARAVTRNQDLKAAIDRQEEVNRALIYISAASPDERARIAATLQKPDILRRMASQ